MSRPTRSPESRRSPGRSDSPARRRPVRPGPERTVAGLSCREVLAVLSDLLEGELEDRKRRRVEAHLAGCDRCRRTGGEVAALVRGCQHLLDTAPPLDDSLRRRLLERIAIEARRG